MAIPIDKNDPSIASKDYEAMAPDWGIITDICAGIRAIKEKRTEYLPKFSRESETAYALRLSTAPWRPEFTDALRNLCSKPFAKPVTINPDAPEQFLGTLAGKTRTGGLIDDIDGRGNSLHVIARQVFQNGVAKGLAAIYVAFPDVGPARTLAEEKSLGVRPYWVEIPALDILALNTSKRAGRDVVSHIRFRECTTEPDGFAEVVVERIRVLELDVTGQPTSALWKKDAHGKYQIEVPAAPLVGVTEIPVALLFTGERSGNYRVKPPLADLAHMQLELYRALSRQDQILTYAGSPMLKAVGMEPPKPTPIIDPVTGVATGERPAAQIEVGPNVVLFAPPAMDGVQPDWDFVQPAAENIKAIEEHVEKLTENFRRLALQPTTSKSGTLTATGAAIEGAKSHSAIEVWANGLADMLDQALRYTTMWLKLPDAASVQVHTDFAVSIQGSEEAKMLADAPAKGTLSRKTVREEWSRRGILGPAFDEDEEQKRLAEEQQGLEPEDDIDPVTGEPVAPPGAVGAGNPGQREAVA